MLYIIIKYSKDSHRATIESQGAQHILQNVCIHIGFKEGEEAHFGRDSLRHSNEHWVFVRKHFVNI